MKNFFDIGLWSSDPLSLINTFMHFNLPRVRHTLFCGRLKWFEEKVKLQFKKIGRRKISVLSWAIVYLIFGVWRASFFVKIFNNLWTRFSDCKELCKYIFMVKLIISFAWLHKRHWNFEWYNIDIIIQYNNYILLLSLLVFDLIYIMHVHFKWYESLTL